MSDDAAIRMATELIRSVGEGDIERVEARMAELRRCEVGVQGTKALVDSALTLGDRFVLTYGYMSALAKGYSDAEGLDGARPTGGLDNLTHVYESLRATMEEKKRLEKKLRDSEELFRTLITASPDEIATTDLQGNLTFVSGAGLRLFGLESKEEAIGRNIKSFIVPEHHALVDKRAAAMQQGSIGVGEYQALRADGSRFWIEINGEVMRDPEGRPVSLLFVVRNVTWRKDIETELKRSEQRYRTLVETATVPIFILGADSTIQYLNGKARGLLGVHDPGAEGRFLDYADGPDWAEVIKGFFDAREGVVREGEVQLHDRRGRKLWAYMSAQRTELDGTTSVFVFCSDITEMKRAEEQLALANRKLTLLGSVTRHDVLNQLTALYGHLELAAMRTTDEAVRKHIDKARQSSAAIQKQMEMTRTYQDVGTMEAAWINVRAATELDLATLDTGRVGVSVEAGEVEVLADPLFVACIHNIVHNAIKHGGKVEHVRITAREESPGLIIAVEDDGKGIPASQKQAIFDWNYNGRSGHGLNFVREVLNSTGMGIRETGTEGRGARFEILVPASHYRWQKK